MANWRDLSATRGSQKYRINLDNVAYITATKEKGTEIVFVGGRSDGGHVLAIFVSEAPDQI